MEYRAGTGQPDAGAARLAHSVAAPEVGIEDAAQLVRRDSHPLILDGQHGPFLPVTFLARCPDDDPATHRAVLDGVGEEVGHHAFDAGLVPFADEPVDARFHLDDVTRAHLLVFVGEPAGDLHNVGRTQVQLNRLTHPETRHVEQLVHQADQLHGALVDRLEAILELGQAGSVGPRQGPLEQVGPTHDDRGRGLEIVGDGGQEFILLTLQIPERPDVLEDRHSARRRAEGIAQWRAVHEDRDFAIGLRSEEHTSELQSHHDLVCRLLLEKKKKKKKKKNIKKKKKKKKKKTKKEKK